MHLNPIWLSLGVMGLFGAVINAVKWFIIEKDFSKGSLISVAAWTGVFAVGIGLAVLF